MNVFFSAAQLSLLQAQSVSQWLVEDAEGNLYSQVDAGLYVCLGNAQEVARELQMRNAQLNGHIIGNRRPQAMSYGYTQGHTPGGFAQPAPQQGGYETQQAKAQLITMGRAGYLLLNVYTQADLNTHNLPASINQMPLLTAWFIPRKDDLKLEYTIPWNYDLESGYQVLLRRFNSNLQIPEPKPAIVGIALPEDNLQQWVEGLKEAMSAWVQAGRVVYPFLTEVTDAKPSETVYLEKNFHVGMAKTIRAMLKECLDEIPQDLEKALRAHEFASFN